MFESERKAISAWRAPEASYILPPVPGKCYRVYSVSMMLHNTAGNTVENLGVICVNPQGVNAAIGDIEISPNLENIQHVSVDLGGVMTKPGTGIKVSYIDGNGVVKAVTDCKSSNVTISYSEIDN